MLRFQTPLTAAAREIIIYCLEVAADEVSDDAPVPSVVTRLRTLAGEQDTAYLHLPQRSRSMAGVWIDFDELIDVYFWDTDFLMDVGVLDHLTPEAKPQLGLSGEVFGVTHALAPHQDELILKRWQEGGSDDAQDREGSDGG